MGYSGYFKGAGISPRDIPVILCSVTPAIPLTRKEEKYSNCIKRLFNRTIFILNLTTKSAHGVGPKSPYRIVNCQTNMLTMWSLKHIPYPKSGSYLYVFTLLKKKTSNNIMNITGHLILSLKTKRKVGDLKPPFWMRFLCDWTFQCTLHYKSTRFRLFAGFIMFRHLTLVTTSY